MYGIFWSGLGGHRKLITVRACAAKYVTVIQALRGKFAEVSDGIWQTGPQNWENLPRKTVVLSGVFSSFSVTCWQRVLLLNIEI